MKDRQLYWWACWTWDKWKSPFTPILPLSSSSLRHPPRLGGAFGSAWPGVRGWSRRIRVLSPNFNMFTEPSVCMCMFSLDPCVQVLRLPACVCVCTRAVCRLGGVQGGQMARGLLSSGALWLPKIRRKQLERSALHSAPLDTPKQQTFLCFIDSFMSF